MNFAGPTNYDGIVNTQSTNGEAWLIERTAPMKFSLAFDVGANVGVWTNCFAKFHPESSIHCFEIVPSTFSILKQKTAHLGQRVILNSFGLSDANGHVDVFVDPTSNVLSRVYDFGGTGSAASRMEECEIRIGDEYLIDKKLGFIDFLKIDVEGAESKVLAGFTDALKSRQVRLVQFEYNRGAIMSHFLLRDFYNFFTSFGYRVGKLYPEGVKFLDYRLEHEDFMGPNYVACLKDDQELIKLISI